MVGGVADHRPLAPHRGVLGQVDEGGPVDGRRLGPEVGEDHRRAGDAGQLGPALLRGPVVVLLLERAEDHRPLGPRAALVLDRPGQRQQRRLPEPLRLQLRVPAAHRGVHRGRPGGDRPRRPGRARPRRSRPRGGRRRRAGAPPAGPGRRRARRSDGGRCPGAGAGGSRAGTPTSAGWPGPARCGWRGRRWSGRPRRRGRRGLARRGSGVHHGRVNLNRPLRKVLKYLGGRRRTTENRSTTMTQRHPRTKRSSTGPTWAARCGPS